MKNYILVFLSLLAISIFSACHKAHEASTAEITFIEPSINDTIAFGTELHVEGTISGDGEMHSYTLNIANADNDSIYFSKSSSAHAESYAFHEHWVNNLTDTTFLKVTIEVELNHEGAKTSKTVNVVCLP